MVDESDKKPLTELHAVEKHELSIEGSVGAPFIYSDWIGSYGTFGGIPSLPLEATRHLIVDGKPKTDRVVVAHLRLSYAALIALGNAVEQVKLMLHPTPSTAKN